jgi:hypothetical protein
MKKNHQEPEEYIDPWCDDPLPGVTDPEREELAQQIETAVMAPQKRYYHEALWKGIIAVWVCDECGHSENTEDDMIMHVLKHVPVEERQTLLEKLMKE